MKKGRVRGREWWGRGGEVNTFMHWSFTSACMCLILSCNALGTTLIVAEANFSYPAHGATEILYIKISVTVSVNRSVFIQGWQNYTVLDY